MSIKKGLKKKDIFFEKMKKWGSGSILDLQNHSSDDGLKKVKFSDPFEWIRHVFGGKNYEQNQRSKTGASCNATDM